MRKQDFCLCERCSRCAINAQLISAFVFAILIVLYLYPILYSTYTLLYLYPKLQDSSFLLWCNLLSKIKKKVNLNKLFQGGNLSKTSSEGRQQWEQIQMRIVKNTAAAVKFASQIPGKLVSNQRSLCKVLLSLFVFNKVRGVPLFLYTSWQLLAF